MFPAHISRTRAYLRQQWDHHESDLTNLTQLSLPLLENLRSNPAIRNVYKEHSFTVNCLEKTNIQKKMPCMGDFFLKNRPLSASFIVYIRTFQTNVTLFTIYLKNVHPVSGTGIRTHDLLEMRFLP